MGDAGWPRYLARRTGQFTGSLLVLITASFLIIHLVPGDPVRAALGMNAPGYLVSARRSQLGLNLPLWQQYLRYLYHLGTGQLGTSISSGLPVSGIVAARLPATVTLAGLAFAVAVAVSVPAGLVMAVLTRDGRRRTAELAFSAVCVVLSSVPGFLLGVGLVYLFAVRLGWAPVAGEAGPRSFVLPVLSLALAPAAVLARVLRLEVLAALRHDYVRTARAKRLPSWRIYLMHVLPNALTATLTIGGLLLAALVAGTVLVENVFAWPGLGNEIVASILAKDYPVVQAIVLVYGAGVLVINLAVDIALALLDPRSTIRDS